MKSNFNNSFIASLILSVVAFTGCVDSDKSFFDADKAREEYQNAFPVKDVDPSMDWKTTQSTKVSVSINEDQLTDYKVQIFDANPLSETSGAKLLAEGYANQNIKFETTMDCPTALSTVFVARVDEKGHYLVKPINIQNNTISAAFGKADSNTTSRAVTRAESSLAIPTYDAPYSEQEILDLLNQATELSNRVSGKDINLGEGGIFKVTKDIECNSFSYGWNKCTIVIANGAKFNVSNEFNGSGRFQLIIVEGELNIKPNSVNISNNGSLTILPKGKLSGKSISFSDNSEGFLNYNAGEIDLKELILSGDSKGTFYNCGKIDIEHNLTGSNRELTLINRGKLEIKGNLNFGSIARLLSACSTEVEGKLECKDLIIGKNSKVKCQDFTTEGANDLTITMEAASMLECTGKATLNRKITGPAATEDYALIKIFNINNGQDYGNTHSSVKGNIYFAINQHGTVGEWNNNGYSGFVHMIERADMQSYICNEKTAPFIMAEDDYCTGNGYTPDEGEDHVEIDPISYTYTYEDNYPAAGDYDFNDIVLDVVTKYHKDKSNKVQSIQYDVTLAAVGASKQLGAGLRLANIPKDAIESIEFRDDNNMRATLANSMFENGNTENDNSVVIPLFGDAHKVYGYESNRLMLNTGMAKTDKVYTLEITIALKDKNQTTPFITKDNLDFFIAYSGGGNAKRTEIHLYEFRNYGATANGTVHQQNLDVAGNYTWGICIPNFKYPTEKTPIIDAYPDFAKWVQNHNNNKDWYEHPTTRTDRKYIYE